MNIGRNFYSSWETWRAGALLQSKCWCFCVEIIAACSLLYSWATCRPAEEIRENQIFDWHWFAALESGVSPSTCMVYMYEVNFPFIIWEARLVYKVGAWCQCEFSIILCLYRPPFVSVPSLYAEYYCTLWYDWTFVSANQPDLPIFRNLIACECLHIHTL